MKIANKYNLGDVVYYPAADLRNASVFKSEVTGIIVTMVDGKESIIYQTGQSYGVSEDDMAKTPEAAKKRLIEIMELKKKNISKDISAAVKTIKKKDIKELIYDLTAQDEETKSGTTGDDSMA